MKGKLVKRGQDTYILLDVDSYIIATNNDRAPSNRKLLKQNCDEIFGIVDVDKLAYDSSQEYLIKPIESPIFTFGYEQGFNKAMELNKDKLFTLEDMKKAIQFGEYNTDIESFEEISEEDTLQFIESLQQPTEIDVVIEMENYGYCEGCRKAGMWHCAHADTCGNAETRKRPKLDLSECLILKKI